MATDQLEFRLKAYFDSLGTKLLGPPTVLRGGWASTLYTIQVRRAELDDVRPTTVVLKFYAANTRGCEHARREWSALTHLYAVNYAVPHAILLEPDVRHLGHPFIVMDHVLGTSFWHTFEAADPATHAHLTEMFVARLTELHALDPHVLEPTVGVTDPRSYLDQELEQLRRDSERSPHVMLTSIVAWLKARKKAALCVNPVILHRDYHPWNVLVDAVGRLWVIDWDWQIGDARFDLAWTCMLMRRSGFHAFSNTVRQEYGRRTDRSLDDLEYFEVLVTIRWLLNVLPSAEIDADFRVFVVEPVRRAVEFLQEHTGVKIDIRL